MREAARWPFEAAVASGPMAGPTGSTAGRLEAWMSELAATIHQSPPHQHEERALSSAAAASPSDMLLL
jgi:hypothetical protein